MIGAQKQEQIERQNSPQTHNKPQKRTQKIKRNHNNRPITHYFTKMERKNTENQSAMQIEDRSANDPIDQTSLKLHEQQQALTERRDQLLHLLQVQKEERDNYVNRIRNIMSQQLKRMAEIDRIFKTQNLTRLAQIQQIRYKLIMEINQKEDIFKKQSLNTLKKIFLDKQILKLKKDLKEINYKISVTQQQQRLYFQQENCYFAKQKWPILNKRYQVLRLIGKGGFSQVYEAFDLVRNQRVAVKLSEVSHLLAGRQNKNDYLRHIKRQYQVHKLLTHPAIVQLIQVFEIDNAICIILQYCEGETLGQMLKRQIQIQQKYGKLVVKQLLQVVKYLSMQKPSVVHYDLKPQNIMFQHGMLKVLDFGVCKTIDSEHSKMALTSQGIGTHCYLPPETFAINNPTLSNKVDIWSIGVIFYQMLYGCRPFGLIGFPVSQEIEFPESVVISQEVKTFIKKCLKINLKERFDPLSALNDSYFST